MTRDIAARAIDAAAADDARVDRMIEAANAERAGADAQIGSEGEREKPRSSSAAVKRVYCGGAPSNEPGGAGCLPDAPSAAVTI